MHLLLYSVFGRIRHVLRNYERATPRGKFLMRKQILLLVKWKIICQESAMYHLVIVLVL